MDNEIQLVSIEKTMTKLWFWNHPKCMRKKLLHSHGVATTCLSSYGWMDSKLPSCVKTKPYNVHCHWTYMPCNVIYTTLVTSSMP